MPLIEGIAPLPYRQLMSVLLRVLVVMTLVLMPFTMTAAPASAHAMRGTAAANMHCDDHQQPQTPRQADLAQCMLMCAALPAAEALTISPPAVPKAPRRLALAEPIHGVILEIATPPPRLA